jgi:hypothetical protein
MNVVREWKDEFERARLSQYSVPLVADAQRLLYGSLVLACESCLAIDLCIGNDNKHRTSATGETPQRRGSSRTLAVIGDKDRREILSRSSRAVRIVS